MPDIVMHHYFGRNVYASLDQQIVTKINNQSLYDFATAGPDPFFFVAFANKKKNIVSREFGNYMHNNNTKGFFIKLIELTKHNHDLFSYLCGFVCHYYLDVYAHPYVFYYTGKFHEDNPDTYEYRGLHTKLERAMDSYIINKYYGNPNKFKIHKKILTLKKLDESFRNDFDSLFMDVYDHENGYQHVNQSIKAQRKFYKFIYDPWGFMNWLLSKLDNGKSSLDLRVLSYYKKYVDDVDIFNEEHSQWLNPVDATITSSKSFFDLFRDAKVEAIDTITALYENIFNNVDNNIESYFKNLSYITGLNCENKKEMINFQNIFKIKIRKDN